MSLYTRGKPKTADLMHPHCRLMVPYFIGRIKRLESGAAQDLEGVRANVAALVNDELSQFCGVYTVLTHDTDCDGTSWQAHRVEYAESENDAIRRFQAEAAYDYWIDGAMPEYQFCNSDSYKALDEWSQGYYSGRGYVTLGNTWS